MKKSELKKIIREEYQRILKEYSPKESPYQPGPVTLPEPDIDEPQVKPQRRRSLTPPKESPNTKPKAEGLDNSVVNKITDRFLKLKSVNEIKVGNPTILIQGSPGFKKFVSEIISEIFKDGLRDPMVRDIKVNDWDTLFEYWMDFGTLRNNTQSDIITLANEVGLTPQEKRYILDLPQVQELERG